VGAICQVNPNPNNMKTKATLFVALLMLSFIFSSCEKAEQFLQKAILKQIITNDRWVVETFTVSGTDVTADYTPFEFEFNTNGTVTAYKVTDAIIGDWKEDISTMSIETHFNSTIEPLQRFNTIWYVGKTASNFVEARAVTANAVFTLKLVKKQ
jgi:hypothetical protein